MQQQQQEIIRFLDCNRQQINFTYFILATIQSWISVAWNITNDQQVDLHWAGIQTRLVAIFSRVDLAADQYYQNYSQVIYWIDECLYGIMRHGWRGVRPDQPTLRLLEDFGPNPNDVPWENIWDPTFQVAQPYIPILQTAAKGSDRGKLEDSISNTE